jgi:hypothetical protein
MREEADIDQRLPITRNLGARDYVPPTKTPPFAAGPVGRREPVGLSLPRALVKIAGPALSAETHARAFEPVRDAVEKVGAIGKA